MSSSIDPRSCRVALLCGGKSNEREISLASGKGAREALETAGFSVTDIDPANKEDLKRLIEEPFDVAFLCMANMAKTVRCRVCSISSASLTRALACGRARLPWTR